MEIVQSDPPPSNRKNSEHWAKVVRTLKENPGVWYHVGTFSASVAGAIRRGTYIAFLADAPGGHKNMSVEDRKAYMRKNYELHSRMCGEKGPGGHRLNAELRVRYIGG